MLLLSQKYRIKKKVKLHTLTGLGETETENREHKFIQQVDVIVIVTYW